MSREELLKEIHDCEQWIAALKQERWPQWEWVDELEARLADLNAQLSRLEWDQERFSNAGW